MKISILNFTLQLEEALKAAAESHLTNFRGEINNVVICGIGHSGLVGNLAVDCIAQEMRMPVMVCKDYVLPNYVNKKTLVIIVSYSGESEEPYYAMKDAFAREAKIVCLTSGGKIGEFAEKKDLHLIKMPVDINYGGPIAYSLVLILHIMQVNYIISPYFSSKIMAAVELINSQLKNILNEARRTAEFLKDKDPVIYSSAEIESAAIRFRQQLNENVGKICSSNTFPDLTHNELHAWKQKNKKAAFVILRSNCDFERTVKRMDISSGIIRHYNMPVKEIYPKGNSRIEELLYLVHWCDWAAYFLSEIKGVDNSDLRVMTYFNSELSGMENNQARS
jgi:glucose/mannose-6-phosphate isomerase